MSARGNIIDGFGYARGLRERIAERVTRLKADHGLTPCLVVVIVGEDPASQIYVKNKGETTRAVGMDSRTIVLPAETTEADLLKLIGELNAETAVNGILVQLPLPAHMSSLKVIDAIDPLKDVDGFHVQNAGRLAVGLDAIVPCTPLGSLMLLKDALKTHGDGNLSGLNAVIVGRSNIVGKPMAQLLLNENCTVTIAHSRTKNLAELCRTADVLVAAVGRPKFVQGDWIKDGAYVIDVGINRIEVDGKGKIVGDVDFDAALPRATAITPVPKGVGPMTIACLLNNTLQAACVQHGLPVPSDL
ncbi:bifunctional methylenetetrahydrofolate dehydrogenase/methenyltetrahydrofolate cyclohydrolase FolD [Asticcacaulis sp. AND118]|uniref:bifunctional methylenetetrahydrofolate dehydrogenase/methenyltetrahydrofolate cyclohydrolase FolD n=1 Tax=Asticcacaulis sp. AND118 TaxID=2840468 RepID=UPI001CFF63A3|nr:bifunctional methylenetetrahydrofolate dehydrogenase/methenyltetrahydrofolate cyclohydrolase FolD [Asticcacaulis sp. AND118]UDF05364.1 bifunctional methylenetetrahydrofolate dehydrogenase/methenyltetrahydrofolate cyclohydrolase FolD [Asticcacaulis sp. AND118]